MSIGGLLLLACAGQEPAFPTGGSGDWGGSSGGDDTPEDTGSEPEAPCWPVQTGWPDCSSSAKGVEGEGWAVGEVQPEWFATDQYGQTWSSRRFHGLVVVVDIGAGWCGPCNWSAPGAQALYAEHKDEGLIVVQLMLADWNSQPTSVDFLQEWQTEHELTLPVVMDESEGGLPAPYAAWYELGYVEGLPTYAIIDREGRLKTIWTGVDEFRLEEEVLAAL
jgi:thiol-disulfide isomerase/thioredoxin